MAKTVAEIRSLARGHTEAALSTLAGIMNQKKAPAAARVVAANSLLDRGWGKSATIIENGEDGAFAMIHTIRRIIVDPTETKPDEPEDLSGRP